MCVCMCMRLLSERYIDRERGKKREEEMRGVRHIVKKGANVHGR